MCRCRGVGFEMLVDLAVLVSEMLVMAFEMPTLFEGPWLRGVFGVLRVLSLSLSLSLNHFCFFCTAVLVLFFCVLFGCRPCSWVRCLVI